MYVPKSDKEWRAFRQWLTLGLCAGGCLVLVVLLARMAVGAITATPGPWTIAVLTAIGFTFAMTAWRLDDFDRPASDLQGRVARLVGAWLAGLLFGLLVARQSTAGVATVSVVAATWVLASAYFVRYSMMAIGASVEDCPGQASGPSSATPSSVVDGALNCPGQVASPDADDSALRLVMRRSGTADGESIEIQARLEFAAGAREAVLHVPLWPALAARPEVESEPLDADDVELKFTSVEPYGIRMEARLAYPAAVARTILIGIELRAPVVGELSAAA